MEMYLYGLTELPRSGGGPGALGSDSPGLCLLPPRVQEDGRIGEVLKGSKNLCKKSEGRAVQFVDTEKWFKMQFSCNLKEIHKDILKCMNDCILLLDYYLLACTALISQFLMSMGIFSEL